MADEFKGRLSQGAQQMLALIGEANRAPIYQTSVALARQAMARLSKTFDMPEQPRGRFEEHDIEGPHGPIPVELTWPHGHQSDALPIIAYFHGGGFVLGKHSNYRRMCHYLANRAQAFVINVDYRLAPEHRFPMGLDDCWWATQWAIRHADRLGLDGARVYTVGDSAGGNLAAGVARMFRDSDILPDVQGQVLFYPVTDFSTEHASRMKYATGKFLERKAMAWYEAHYIGNETDRQNPLVSPLVADDMAGLPPACIITAEMDILCDEAEALAHKMAAAGVPTDYRKYPGMIHGFVSMSSILPEAYRALNQAADWVKNRAYGPLA